MSSTTSSHESSSSSDESNSSDNKKMFSSVEKRRGEFFNHFENDIWNKIGRDISNAYENKKRCYKVNRELFKLKQYSFRMYKQMFEKKLALYFFDNEYSVEDVDEPSPIYMRTIIRINFYM